jgi:hypothetical protein
VPAFGFAVSPQRKNSAAWVFTGDTSPNPVLWRRLTGMRIAHRVIETDFSDDEQQLAQRDGEVQAVMDQIESQTMRHSASALHGVQVFAL